MHSSLRLRHIVALGALLAGCSSSHGRDDGGLDAEVLRDGTVVDAMMTTDAAVSCSPSRAADAVCGAALCGNASIDSCPECGPCLGGGPPGLDAGTCCRPRGEACDGVALGGATCASLGFAGGSLACRGNCAFDTDPCDPCVHVGGVVACARASVDDADASSLALAAGTSGGVGMVWVTSGATVHFALVAPDLTVRTERVLADATCSAPGEASVAIAAAGTGWFVAVSSGTATTVTVLDAGGAVVRGPVAAGGHGVPFLAGRPTGAPLLVIGGTATEATLLADDGTPTWRATLFADVVEPQYGSVVFANDAFVAAQRGPSGVTTVRVELDGRVGAAHVVGSGPTEYPQVAWTATGGRITWADFGGAPTLYWQALDSGGAPVGAPALLSAPSLDYDYAPLVTDGEDSVVLLPGYSGGTGRGTKVEVRRYGPSGVPSASAVRVDAEPTGFYDYRIVPHGSRQVLLGWITAEVPHGVVLATVTP